MRIQKLFASKPGFRYSIYGLSLLALLTLAVARPLYRAVAASGPSASQKGVIAGPEVDKGALAAARAALQAAIDAGTFELMSGAKQTALLAKARMRYEGGVLKEAFPQSPSQFVKDESDQISSPFTALANPLVNNPAADATAQKTQSETSIIVTGANSAVTAFNDSGSFLGGVNSFTGYSTSTDMGTTWTDRGIVPLLGDQNFGDPVLARSAATGTVFLATLAGGANGMNIYRSTDSGVTFSSLANGAPGANSGDTDKEWIAVDNFAGTGNGFVYHVYRDFGAPNGIFFTRSTNDGVTYSAPISIASGAGGNVQGAFTFVGADHAVYAGFYDSIPTPDRIAIRKSTDQGLTFAAAVGVSNLITTGTNGSLNVPAGYRSSAFPQFIASPTTANLLFAIHPDVTVAGGSDSNIFFQQSTDGGATWSANQKLNTDAGTNVQTQPAIAITPDGTALSVTWQDSRADVANRQVQRFGVIGTISGTTVTFGPNFQVSQPLWSPVFGADPVVNTVYMGDYDTMAADNSFFYTTFVDCRTGDQDVRFAKIPKAGPGAIIGFGGATPTFLPVATSTCNDLFVTLANNGTATANAVSATFTTATPGVTLQNATQNYGNIAPGASVTNATAIKLSIANTFVCGTTIVIDVAVSTGETFSFSIGTQGLGYVTTTMTGQSIVPGTTNIGNSGDDVTTNIALPFPFTFYGVGFASANVSSNGNLQFTSNSTAFTNVCPFPVASMNNLISPYWDDQRTDRAGGGIFTSVSGVAPARIFNIEWRTVTFSTPETALSYEARLYETTGQIDFIYANVTGNATNMNGSSATVGIQKGTGSGGASDFTSFACNTATLSSGLKVSFNLLTNCPTGTGPCATASPTPIATPEVEPNNTTGTATPLPLNQNCGFGTGAIPIGDTDFWSIVVPANSKVYAFVDTGNTAGDPALVSTDSQLTLLAPDGTTQVEFDDDDGTGTGGDTTIEATLCSNISGASVATAGTYFLKINGFSATTTNITIYRLFVLVRTAAPTPEVESNNTSGTANPLITTPGTNGFASGSIASAGDQDFYSVSLEAGNILYVSLDNAPGHTPASAAAGNDLDFDIIAPDGTTVLLTADSDSTSFTGQALSEGTELKIATTGIYFIRVRDIGAVTTGAYELAAGACAGPSAIPCVLTCPANITVSTDPNLCTAIVNYPAPTTTGTCGTVTCTPPSGAAFPKGTTTVTCSSAGTAPNLGPGVDTSFSVPPTEGKAGGTVGGTAGKSAGPGVGKIPAASYSGGGAGPGHGSPGAPASPFAVLYSQIDNPGPNATGSQNFEAANDAFDDEVADDFVVPPGVNWTVNQVFVDGIYFNGPGPATSVNVVFYSDSATLPGAVVATRLNQTFVDAAGDFTVNVSPTVVLAPGTYWVEVQANMNFTPNGQWGWTDRTTTSNSGSAWRNAGGGFATPCTPGFGRKTTCIPTSASDTIFQILGTSAPLAGGSTCTFTVTVNDTQPPSITCPPNISAVLPTPGSTCVVVTYCPPTVTDNCPMVTFACVPPSGSCFVPGTTTVTCTATDMSGNTASCSFTVTVFNVCIQDDTNPNNVLLFITSGAQIGQYRFCCDGTTFTGTGTVKQIGSTITLTHQPADRRVQGTLNIDGTGTASLQAPPGTTRCTITDRPNIGVHTCICGSPGSGCN